MRLFLVEDHPAMREGLKFALTDLGFEVCGVAATAAEAEAAITAAGADAAIVDLSLEGGSGLDLIARLCGAKRRPAVVVYSMHESASRVRAALAAGADAYVTKREPASVLGRALEEVRAERPFVSPRAAAALGEEPDAGGGRPPLSPREGDTYRLLGEGLGTEEIARRLGISPRTVESYFARLQTKLGLRGMSALRRDAIANREP